MSPFRLVAPFLTLHFCVFYPTGMIPTRGRRPYRLTVRIISVVCALCVMAIYSRTLVNRQSQTHLAVAQSSSRAQNLALDEAEVAAPHMLIGRRLFQYSTLADFPDKNLDDGDGGESGDNQQQDNCTAPRSPHQGYNDSCSFVLAECSGNWVLFDYLRFVLCDMRHAQVCKCRVWQCYVSRTKAVKDKTLSLRIPILNRAVGTSTCLLFIIAHIA